jgi:hypothetical protein
MDFGVFTQLGVAGFSLLILWWMYKDFAQRLDARDEAMRTLEHDIRNKFSGQLQENTNAMLQHSRIMERVVQTLSRRK